MGWQSYRVRHGRDHPLAETRNDQRDAERDAARDLAKRTEGAMGEDELSWKKIDSALFRAESPLGGFYEIRKVSTVRNPSRGYTP